MKPAPFEYTRAATTEEAVSTLARLGEDGRVLAGGQSLVPLMSFRLARPAHLVDISRIPELDYLRRDGDWLLIGAATRQVTLERSAEARNAAPLLVEAVRQVGHEPIRHRGTVCGCIAHGEPAAELPAAALALGATVILEGADGRREVPIEDFLVGPYETSIRPGELLRELRVRCWSGTHGSAFVEYSRRHGDFAIAGVAAVLGVGPEGSIERAAIALCGLAPTAVRAHRAEEALRGRQAVAGSIDDGVLSAALEDLHPTADIHGSSDYRLRVARACIRQALVRAIERAQGEARS